MNSRATSVMARRLHRSAIAACLVYFREIDPTAFWEFCNTSGNPAGRPRGRHRDAPYDDVLGQMVTIREGGTERRVPADEAFLLHLAKREVEGDSAAHASLAVIEEASNRRSAGGPLKLVLTAVAPGS